MSEEDRSRLEVTTAPKRAEITGFSLNLGLGGTVTVSTVAGEHWIKPHASSGLSWDGLPEEEEIRAAVQLLLKGVVGPVTEEIVAMIHEKLK